MKANMKMNLMVESKIEFADTETQKNPCVLYIFLSNLFSFFNMKTITNIYLLHKYYKKIIYNLL